MKAKEANMHVRNIASILAISSLTACTAFLPETRTETKTNWPGAPYKGSGPPSFEGPGTSPAPGDRSEASICEPLDSTIAYNVIFKTHLSPIKVTRDEKIYSFQDAKGTALEARCRRTLGCEQYLDSPEGKEHHDLDPCRKDTDLCCMDIFECCTTKAVTALAGDKNKVFRKDDPNAHKAPW